MHGIVSLLDDPHYQYVENLWAELQSDTLAHIVHYLSERNFNWKITVDNLALIYDSGTGQKVHYQYKLRMKLSFGF